MSSNTFISATDGQIVLFLTPGDLAALKQAAAFPFALRYRLSDKEPFVLPSWSPRREALASRYSTEQAQSDYLAYKGIPPHLDDTTTKELIARREALFETTRKQQELRKRMVKESHAHLFATLIEPKRGPRPGQDKLWRKMAWSYFEDLAAIRKINSATPQCELFHLITEELFAWGIRVKIDALRHMGTDWKAELRQLAPLEYDEHCQ